MSSKKSNNSLNNSKRTRKGNPCIQKDGIKVIANQFEKKYRELNKECEETKYGEITKYFNQDKNTLKDLLICLKNIYEKEKTRNPNFIMTLCGSSRDSNNPNIKSFIEDYFPRDHSVGNTNFKRQHVFEALCKLILLFDYDNGYYGKKDGEEKGKEFYVSLEKYKPTSKNIETKEQILNSGINVGNNAGVVDIFFSKNKSKKQDSKWACELNNLKEIHDLSDNNEFILVQNKYYTKEFSDVEKYDYSKILRKAKKLNSKDFNNFKIVLMVNNSKVLSEKINYEDESLEILENDKLEEWFTNFLIDLNKLRIEEFIGLKTKRTNNTIQPRFHQELFIETTNEYLNKTGSDKRKKFIWGAVPRSGKSFMIAGMISKRAKTAFNDIILILGAKTETQKQFVDIFETKGFIDFENYGVIYDGNIKVKKEKNIYIFSQEKFKANNENSLTKDERNELKTLNLIKKQRLLNETEKIRLNLLLNQSKQKEYRINSKVKESFRELLEPRNHIDIYFDEIHKGGSTEKSREILKSFENENMSIDLFVMVTATFAKPNIAYEEFMEGYTPIVLEWNYEDQQLMKNIHNNEVNIDLIKYNRNKQNSNQDAIDNTEYDVITRLFDEYNYKYGENYKQILAKQYKHHPELVLINPETLDLKQNSFDFSSKDISDYFFKLDCKAIDYTNKSQLKDYTNIFENSVHVDELIKLIGDFDSKGLANNCLYSILKDKTKFDFDCLNKRSSQLWFLPTNNLYNDLDCQPKYPDSLKKIDRGGDGETYTSNNDYESKQKDPRPHIEPLTRGVALALMNNALFETKFNVLIIHTNGGLYELSSLRNEINCVCVGDKKKSIVDKIQEYEIESYKKGKGVIILTGTILRLGVSLPCVDLAINFDNLSSVDLNYQTMFRVLTESSTNREKKYGYYVDLNKDRSIKFIYDYTQIYSNRLKTCKTIEDLADAQQNILQLFNFNGLTFRKQKIKEKLSLYSKMVSELKLDVETIKNKYMNNFQDTIGKLILKINDIKDLNELNKQINIKFKNNSTKIKKDVEEGKKKQKAPRMPDEDDTENSTNDNSEEENDEEASQLEIQKNMKAFLPGIVFMLAYFSEEYKCNNLEQCLTNAIEEIDKFEDTLCKCENTENFYLACYFDKFRNPKNKYKKDEFKKILVSLKQILFETDTYLTIRNSLIIFYDSIILSFNMNQSGGSNISSKKEYEPLIYKIYQKDKTQNKENFNKWIEETIYKFLPIRDEAKDKHGEVFTPRELIVEMMNKLNEIDPSVFKNKDLTWLDPANGVGNFPLIVYGMLMKSLKSSIPDDYKRSQHILQKMLYMVELQTDNYEVSRKLFGKHSNIYCGSFLSPDNKSINPNISKKFKLDKYDIIMGNPPFQISQEGKRKGGYGGRTLWDKFIKESLNKLKDSGFLCFINPQSWRKPEHELWEEMTQKRQLHFIKILSESDGKRQFGADTKPDSYILQNKLIFKNTNIIDETGIAHNLNLKNSHFLPNFEYKNINKILTTKEKGIDVIYSSSIYDTRKLKDTKTSEFKYPVVHSLNLQGMTLWYTNDKNKGHFGVSKVLLNFGRYQYPYNDFEGKYGMSQITFGIPISSKKEGDLIVKAINTPKFKEIIKATKWGAFQTDYRMFKYLKKDFWKEFVDENGNVLNNSENKSPTPKTKKVNSSVKPSEPIYMVKCPSKILNDPTIETHQERIELCRRHYEDKPIVNPKPSADVFCPKIKTKKDCEHMKKCSYKDGKCSKKNIIKFKPKLKSNSKPKSYDGPHKDKYLERYTKKFGSKKYNSLNNAQRNANTNNTVGGITEKKGKFSIRKGRALKESKTKETSWLKKYFN